MTDIFGFENFVPDLSDHVKVARIEKATNVVVNLEFGVWPWFEEQNAVDQIYYFVQFDDDNPAYIGLTYDLEVAEFEQPPPMSLPQDYEPDDPWIAP